VTHQPELHRCKAAALCSIAVAHAAGGSAEPPVFVGLIGPCQADLDHLLRCLQGKASALHFA
jgi:hypothetical protein